MAEKVLHYAQSILLMVLGLGLFVAILNQKRYDATQQETLKKVSVIYDVLKGADFACFNYNK